MLLAAARPALADVVWTGAVSTDAFDDGNWDFSSSTLTAIDPDVTIDDDVVIDGATVSLESAPGGSRFQLGDGRVLRLRSATIVGGGQRLTAAPGAAAGATVRLADHSLLWCSALENGIALELDSSSRVDLLLGTGDPLVASTCDVMEGSRVRIRSVWVTPATFAAQFATRFTVAQGPAVLGHDLIVREVPGGPGCEVLGTDPALGTRYCWSNPTGTGLPSTIEAHGTALASADSLLLVCRDMPQNMFAFFLTSRTQGFVPHPGSSFSHNCLGNLCLGGAIGRFVGPGQIQHSGSSGLVWLRLDLTRQPTPTGLVTVLAGETWNFQCWHRDLGAISTSNFSDAIEVRFR